MRALRTLLAAAAGLVLLTAAPQASAQVEARFGLGSRASALAGAFTALADDTAAVHYNPAGLAMRCDRRAAAARGLDPSRAESRGIGIHLGYMWARPNLWVRGGRVDGDRVVFDSDAEVDFEHDGEIAHEIGDAAGITFGVRVGLNELLKAPACGLTVALGLGLYMPTGASFRWDVMGSERLQWPMYLDRDQRMSIIPAVGIRFGEYVALGFGMRTSVIVETNTEALLVQGTPPTDGGPAPLGSEMGNHAQIAGEVAPTFSVLIDPASWLRIGAILRLEIVSDDFGFNDVDTGLLEGLGLGSFGYTHRFAHFYSPLEVQMGVVGRLGAGLTLSADLAWADWGDALDSNHANHGGQPFTSIWTPRFGVAWAAHPSTELLAGYAYEPSPFDNGGYWTNFVDADKHIVGLGTQTDLMAALGVARRPVRLSWHAQLHVLREHREVKDWHSFADATEAAANPGWPGWLAGGWILNLGISLDAEF